VSTRLDPLASAELEIKPGLTCDSALRIVRLIADHLARGEVEPKRASNAIYWAAWHAGAWTEGDKCPELAGWGSEFLQLADALGEYQDDPRSLATLIGLTRAAAAAIGSGSPMPEWRATPNGIEVQPSAG
jgi:hypothetical protein